MRTSILLASSLALFLSASAARAADATPANYTSVLPTLKPGDTLNLAPGKYTSNLNIKDLNGSEGAWITIAGPASGEPAIFEGDSCCNTVEITNSSYVAVKNITVDGKGLSGVFGVSAKNGLKNVVHHITIEGCKFVGQGGSQQTVAISTKTPTWGWTIRGNIIDGAGTGLYLGNSTYSDPFIEGVIEHNLVMNTLGYNMQIKDQSPWPAHPGIPAGDTRTIVRHNVFVKNDAPSPDGVRPNLFVGAFPDSGPGSGSHVEVYGNLFVHNALESLLQATGSISIHDNIFVDASDIAINLRDHDGFPLRRAHVYNNTIYGAKRGIVFGNAATESDHVLGNLILADMPTQGPIAALGENVVDSVVNGPMYVASPSTTLGQMDVYPLAGKAKGAPLDLTPFEGEADFMCDFNGTHKGDRTYRGAYAGEGENPGWALGAEMKPQGLGCGEVGGGGAGGGSTSAAAGSGGAGPSGAGGGDGGAAGATGSDAEDHGGCGCRAAGSGERGLEGMGLAALAAFGAAFARRLGRSDAARGATASRRS